MNIKEKLKNYAKENNLYYENVAAYINELETLGYDKYTLDALKHVIASAHSTVKKGQWTTNVLGHANEAYAAYQARDNFGEHNKDHFNNVLGMTLGGWLNNTLGRPPTLPEIATAVGVLAGEGMVASQKPKGSSNVWHSMASGALASFWGNTIRNSTIQRLDTRRNQILTQIRQMSDDGRMGRLQQFVDSGAAQKLKFTDKSNKKALMGLVHGEAGNNAVKIPDALQRSPARSADLPGLDSRKRDRGDLQGLSPAGQPDPDRLTPDRGDTFAPSFGGSVEPRSLNPDPGNLRNIVPEDQADHMASLAGIDELDIYQMAEEVFSRLTLDDWAIIRDDNDPFDNRDPFANGVKWVPGLGPPPGNP